MRLWKAHWCDPSDGQQRSWHGSRREARKVLAAAKRGEYGSGRAQEPMGVDLVVIPTDKVGLLWWLNANASSDNG